MNSNKKINSNVYDEQWLNSQISSIGKNIREERLKRDLSYRDLSKLANVDSSQIYKIEIGATKVGVLTLVKVIIALEISPNTLISINT